MSDPLYSDSFVCTTRSPQTQRPKPGNPPSRSLLSLSPRVLGFLPSPAHLFHPLLPRSRSRSHPELAAYLYSARRWERGIGTVHGLPSVSIVHRPLPTAPQFCASQAPSSHPLPIPIPILVRRPSIFWFEGARREESVMLGGRQGHRGTVNNSPASMERYVFHVLIEVSASFRHGFRMSSSGNSSWRGDLPFWEFLSSAWSSSNIDDVTVRRTLRLTGTIGSKYGFS